MASTVCEVAARNLQFAYFSRKSGGVIGIDPVGKMREVAAESLVVAEDENGLRFSGGRRLKFLACVFHRQKLLSVSAVKRGG